VVSAACKDLLFLPWHTALSAWGSQETGLARSSKLSTYHVLDTAQLDSEALGVSGVGLHRAASFEVAQDFAFSVEADVQVFQAHPELAFSPPVRAPR